MCNTRSVMRNMYSIRQSKLQETSIGIFEKYIYIYSEGGLKARALKHSIEKELSKKATGKIY